MKRKTIVIAVASIIVVVVAVLGIINLPYITGSPSISIQEWNSDVYFVNRGVHIVSGKEDFLFVLEPQIMIENKGNGPATDVKVYCNITGGPIDGDKKKVIDVGKIEPNSRQTVKAQYYTDWIEIPFPTYTITMMVSYQGYNPEENNIITVYLTPKL